MLGIGRELYKQQQIAMLKAQARKHYRAWQSARDRLSCGAHLASYISPDVASNAAGFNRAMDALAELDPATPKARL